MRVLWLKPRKTNLSHGRQLIANELGDTKVSSSLKDVFNSDYDVYIGTTRIGAFGAIIAKIGGKKVIIDHVDPISQYRGKNKPLIRIVENISFLIANRVLVTTDKDWNRVKRYNKNTVKSYLCLDYYKFSNPSDDSISSAKYAMGSLLYPEKDKPIVTYVGGLEPVYNLDKLLLAFKHIPEFNLCLVGEGSLRQRLEETKFYNDIKNVKFLGSVDYNTIPGILNLSDVCVTLCETPRQVKILEYVASGTPTVAPNSVEEFFPMIKPTSLKPKDIAESIRRASIEYENQRGFVKDYDYRNIAKIYKQAIE